jgi:hypothetical protein
MNPLKEWNSSNISSVGKFRLATAEHTVAIVMNQVGRNRSTL